MRLCVEDSRNVSESLSVNQQEQYVWRYFPRPIGPPGIVTCEVFLRNSRCNFQVNPLGIVVCEE